MEKWLVVGLFLAVGGIFFCTMLRGTARLKIALLTSTCALVVVIETITRMKGGAPYDTLQWIHLAFAVPFGIAVAVLTIPKITRAVIRGREPGAVWLIGIVGYVGSAFTGLPMVFTRW